MAGRLNLTYIQLFLERIRATGSPISKRKKERKTGVGVEKDSASIFCGLPPSTPVEPIGRESIDRVLP
ncbi:hypothetical protein PGT21_019149 [Puccinia graminis f. sp. tritici]|uniref:Uncharacterized protein n=1 Tax=Puccinia graminis f. sp. tritici TaxID=56615 RepID=A0A5B0P790_PUCGR|nr:hypothetical protein PGT21_019149 [Puccinia graminis f. sp. tritici]